MSSNETCAHSVKKDFEKLCGLEQQAKRFLINIKCSLSEVKPGFNHDLMAAKVDLREKSVGYF